MGIENVLAAAVGSWIFGAVWYGVMSKRWMAAVGLTDETMNKKNISAFVVSFVCAIIVAGMMRHIFVMGGIADMATAIMSGFGLGLFIATPWIATNYMFAQRPVNLIVIDGIYATIGSTIMAILLTAF